MRQIPSVQASRRRVLGWVALALTPTLAACANAEPPDLILHNGQVFTGADSAESTDPAEGTDPAEPSRPPLDQAVAITGGLVTGVGSDEAILGLAGAATRVIDVGGRTVVPGLTDNHFHGIGGGPGVDLSGARSFEDVLARLGERAATTPAGEVIVTNSDWHEGQLREQRLLLRDELDRATTDHPVVVVRGGHEFILNSAALERWGISPDTRSPEGGRIGRYPDGRLNGELVDQAKDLVDLPPSEPSDLRQVLKGAIRTMNGLGVTSLRIPGGSPEQFAAYQELERSGELHARVDFLFRPRGVGADGIAAAVAEWGAGPGERSELVTVQGVKLGVDGGFEGGLMREPYLEPWGEGGTYYGLQTRPTEDFTQLVGWLNREGWRVATHAVGDAAMDLVLDAYEAAHAERSLTGRRWTIEHAFIPAEDHFERMRRMGLTVTAQNHLYVAAPSLVSYWGPERAALTTPVGIYVEEGIPVSLGTDSPVIPYNPFWVLYHFTTRGTLSAGVQGAQYAVDRETALRLMTAGYAFQVEDEGMRGTIEVGMKADLAVLSGDYFTVGDDDLEDLTAVVTVVGGRVVWDGSGL